MIKKLFIFFLFFLFYKNIFATEIRIIDLNHLINSNNQFINFISIIEKDQIVHKDNFSKQENILKERIENIEELKLILSSDEIDKEINKYNTDLKIFNDKIKKFNFHYENQINNFKNILMKHILDLLKDYSNENKIDLILDANSYIIATNAINITEVIYNKLDKIKLNKEFEKYKQD